MATRKPVLKTTIKVIDQFSTLYTGGPLHVSPCGLFLACACGEETKIIDVASSKVLATIESDSDVVTSLALKQSGSSSAGASSSPSASTILAVASRTQHIRIFEVPPRDVLLSAPSQSAKAAEPPVKLMRALKAHDGPVLCMEFDSTGTLLATGAADRQVKVWDILQGYCTHVFKGHHQSIVTAIRFIGEGQELGVISGDEDGKLCLWDLMKSICLAELSNHESDITSIDFLRDGTEALTTSRDKMLSVWSLKHRSKPTLLRSIPCFESLEAGVVVDAEFLGEHLTGALSSSEQAGHDVSPNKRRRTDDALPYAVLTGGAEGILKLVDPRTGRVLLRYGTPQRPHERDMGVEHGYAHLQRVPGSHLLVAATTDHNIVVYGVEADEQQGWVSRKRLLIGHNEEVIDLRYVPGHEEYVVAATSSELVRVYHLPDHDTQLLRGHTGTVLALDVSPCGQYIATASKDMTLRLWGVQQAESSESIDFVCIGVCRGHIEAVSAVAWARRSRVYVASVASDKTLKLWATASLCRSGAPSQNVDIVDVQSPATVKAHDKDINSVAVSPNNRMIATGSADKTAKIWDVDPDLLTVQLAASLQGHKRGVWCVQFSPIDQVAASSSGDKTVRLWSVGGRTPWQCLRTLEGHGSSVLRVSFATTGLQLFSAGADGLVRLWNVRTSECAGTFDAHDDRVWALDLRPNDEMQLVTGASDSTIKIWNDVSADVAENEAKEKEQALLREQEAFNAVRTKDYKKAVHLALELDQPRRLFWVFESLSRIRQAGPDKDDEGADNGIDRVSNVSLEESLEGLTDDQLATLLRYIRDWNTHAARSAVAQRCLVAVISCYTADRLAKVPNIREILEGLIAYTSRHRQRLDLLQQQAFIVTHVVHTMHGGVLDPQ